MITVQFEITEMQMRYLLDRLAAYRKFHDDERIGTLGSTLRIVLDESIVGGRG